MLSAGFWNRDGGLYIKDFVLALFELCFATCVRKIKEIDIVQIYHFLILISSTQIRSFRRTTLATVLLTCSFCRRWSFLLYVLSKDVRCEKDRIIIETQNADHSSYHLTEGRDRMERNRSRLGSWWNLNAVDHGNYRLTMWVIAHWLAQVCHIAVAAILGTTALQSYTYNQS